MIPGNIFKSTYGLQRIKAPAHGGLCSIEFVPVDWVLYLPEVNPLYNTITQKIRLIDGKYWQLCPTPDRDRSLVETPKDGDAGPYVDSDVQAFLPFDSAANEVALKVMRYYKYLVVVSLSNGIRKLLGTIDNPVIFNRSFSTGSDIESDMGSPVTFSWTNEDGPCVYMGIPSESEIVAAAPQFIIGTGEGSVIGDGSGSVIGTNAYP